MLQAAADKKLCALELACRERHLGCAWALLLAGAAPTAVANRPRRYTGWSPQLTTLVGKLTSGRQVKLGGESARWQANRLIDVQATPTLHRF